MNVCRKEGKVSSIEKVIINRGSRNNNRLTLISLWLVFLGSVGSSGDSNDPYDSHSYHHTKSSCPVISHRFMDVESSYKKREGSRSRVLHVPD